MARPRTLLGRVLGGAVVATASVLLAAEPADADDADLYVRKLSSPAQVVQIHFDDGTVTEGRFHANVHGQPDGTGHGQLVLSYPSAGADNHPDFIWLPTGVNGADLIRSDDGPILTFTGDGEMCVRPGGDCRQIPITGSVRPDPAASEWLRYELVGPGFGARFEATGSIEEIRQQGG